MNKLVSVIVPIYKVEQYLKRCIDSIINQTYQNLEIILVDDGSPDNCPQICNEYAKKDNRIKVIHKQNGGLMQAWIDGINASHGQYIYFIDSDDWLELNSVEDYMNIVDKYNPELIINSYYFGNEQEKVKTLPFVNKYEKINKLLIDKELDELKDQLLNKNKKYRHYRWNKFFKRELVIDNIKFCDTRVSRYEDVCISLASICDAKSVYVNDNPTYNYFYRPTSMINKSFNKQDILNNEYVFKSIQEMFISKNITCMPLISSLNIYFITDLTDRIMSLKDDYKKLFNLIHSGYLINNDYRGVIKNNLTLVKKISYNLFEKKKFWRYKIFRKLVLFIKKLNG